MRTFLRFYAGAPFMPGTNLESNVTGECGHNHKTPEAAQKCIDDEDAAIKRGHGRNAYSDRIVMVAEHDTETGNYLSGTTHVWTHELDLEDL